MAYTRGDKTLFEHEYDEAKRNALAAGVCPKIIAANQDSPLRACGRPLADRSQWCDRHAHGI